RRTAEKFPLTLHRTGQWCKKHRGRTWYFGKDKAEALKRFKAEWADILAGRTPKAREHSTTLPDLVNAFLTAKLDLVRSDELTPRHWSDLRDTCAELVEFFGWDRSVPSIGPDDLGRLRAKMAQRFGPVALGNAVQRVKTIL